MGKTIIRVRYENGILRPLERIDFKEGEELNVVIVRKKFHGFHEDLKDIIIESNRDILEEFLKERR